VTRRLALRRARSLHEHTDPALARRSIGRAAKLESGVPPSPRITQFVQEHAPDVLLVSPVIDLASPLVDYLRRRVRSASEPASALPVGTI
jgi:hypothetical protein